MGLVSISFFIAAVFILRRGGSGLRSSEESSQDWSERAIGVGDRLRESSAESRGEGVVRRSVGEGDLS